MLIDGEKYACEACVRGHRVSNCNHYERPLTHINKKGRPVSQCPHCRGLRKARSSHVKCECGDKVTKAGSVSPSKRGEHKCGCGQGQRCTCAVKKEHLLPINELKKPIGLQRSRSHTDSHKPRSSPLASPLYSDSPYLDHPLTVFQNGHHKPVHHLNQAAHDLGLPYKIPRPHSIHGNSSLANASTDSLPLLSDFGSPSPYAYEFMAQEEAMHHSAHNSPALKPKVDMLNQLPQLDLSYTALNTGDVRSITSSPHPEEYQPNYSMAYFNTMDQQTPLSAISGENVDMGLGLQGAFGNDYTSQPPYPRFETTMPTSHPGMTTSPSGEASESEDYINAAVHSPALYAHSPYLAPSDAGLGFHMNVSTDSLGNLTPPSSMPTSGGPGGGLNGNLIDAFGGGGVGSPIPQLSPDVEHDSYGPHFAMQDSQKRGLVGPRDISRGASPSHFRPTSDPTWTTSFADDGFMPNDRFQAQAAWGQ